MSQNSITKADILRAIDTERQWWQAIFDLASEDGPLTGNEIIDGSWTFKTLIAHIDGWRVWTLTRLQAAANNSGMPIPPWPASLSDTSESDVDKINAWFDDQSRKQSLETVITNFETHLDRLRAVVERIPEDDLLTPGRFAWLGEEFESRPIGPALIDFSNAHVHIDHAPALESWLTQKRGQHTELPPIPSDLGFVQ